MILPFNAPLNKTRRLGQAAIAALLIGISGGAIATLPLGNLAFADPGGGNGHGGDHGGDHGGGHGGGDHGGGDHGGGGNGNGGGQGKGGGQGSGGAQSVHDGPGPNAGPGDTSDDSTTDDSTADESIADDSSSDDSTAPHNLGKLNGVLHASPRALAKASPNSPVGAVGQTLRDALSDYGTVNDPNADPTGAPTTEDLGHILSRAVNKTVTAAQVREIVEHLAEQNPDDASLNNVAQSLDDATCQAIADAANESQDESTTDDDSTTDDSSTETTSDDSSSSATASDNDGTNADSTTTVATTTNE